MSDKENQKKDRTMFVVGTNLAILIGYAVWTRATGGNDGALSFGLLLIFHIVLCMIISPFIYSKGFLLSALVILLVGFSTCYFVY